MTDAVAEQAAFSRKCAIIAAQAADEKKATDIMVQEVRELIGVTAVSYTHLTLPTILLV